MRLWKATFCFAAAALGVLCAPTLAQQEAENQDSDDASDPALLAYEGFDYETGGVTDKGSAEDAGWGGAWKVGKSDGISASIVDDGLSFGTLESAGRAMRLQTNLERGSDRYNRAARALAPKDEVSGTVWHSHLIHVQPMTRKLVDGGPKAEQIETLEQRWEARVDVDSTGDTDRTGNPDVMGFAAKADAKTPLGRLLVAGKGVTSTGTPIQVDTTYLVLGKVEGIGGTDEVEITTIDPETAETVQTQGYRYKATMWVLSEENFQELLKSGRDESVLDEQHVQHATQTVETEPNGRRRSPRTTLCRYTPATGSPRASLRFTTRSATVRL